MIDVPNVVSEPRVKFFKGLPKIGGYAAVAVQSSADGYYKAVLAADTLIPEGHGQKLSQDELNFMWDVSRALSSALDGSVGKQEEAAASSECTVVETLQTSITEAVAAYKEAHPGEFDFELLRPRAINQGG